MTLRTTLVSKLPFIHGDQLKRYRGWALENVIKNSIWRNFLEAGLFILIVLSIVSS